MKLIQYLVIFFCLFFKYSLADLNNQKVDIPTYFLKQNISIDKAINHPGFKKENLQKSDIVLLENRNFWIKIPLENKTNQTLKKSIVFFWTNAKIDLYYTRNNQIFKHLLLYDKERVGHLVDQFSIEPNSTIDLYIKSNEKKGFDIFKYISIVDQNKTSKLIAKENSYFNNGLLFGILLSMFFFNIIVYVAIKEVSLLFFCIFVLRAIIYASDDTYRLLELLQFNNQQIIQVMNIIIPGITLISFLLFTKYFFETKDRPWINTLIHISLFMALVLILYNLIFNQYSFVPAVFILPFFFGIGLIYLKQYFFQSLLYLLSFPFFYYPFVYYYFHHFDFYEYSLSIGIFINNLQLTSTIASILLCFSIYIKLRNLFVEKLTFQQELVAKSRLSAMGEMIANIAHQWRQPLNDVTTTLANIEMASEMNKLNHNKLKSKIDDVNFQMKYMSNTIDDFLNFFSSNKETSTFTLSSAVESAFSILNPSFTGQKITLHVKVDKSTITSYKNELVQVLMIILNNAKDVLEKSEDKDIWITIKEKKVTIEDSGKGIQLDNINKVFEPYFSTKTNKNGTGLGLYMAKIIVEKNLKGSLEVTNTTRGAKFIINLADLK